MPKVAEVMTRALVTVSPWASVRQAARIMAEHRIGSLPVLEDGILLGLVTSRDLRGAHPNRMVADVMRPHPLTVPPGMDLFEAARLMREWRVERLLVAEGERLLGLFTKQALAFALGQRVDPLTGLPRADFLRHRLETLLSEGLEPTLVFVDLNDFGRLNKLHGHPLGDRILKALGERLKAFAEAEGGEAFRYGGDEFALLFPIPRAEVLPKLPALFHPPLEVEGVRAAFALGVAGGRRRKPRAGSPAAVADDLIRLASLASTRAKTAPPGLAEDGSRGRARARAPKRA